MVAKICFLGKGKKIKEKNLQLVPEKSPGFSIPNIFDTYTGTFFRYQIFPIPVPIPPKKMKIPGTGTSHSGYIAKQYCFCRVMYMVTGYQRFVMQKYVEILYLKT